MMKKMIYSIKLISICLISASLLLSCSTKKDQTKSTETETQGKEQKNNIELPQAINSELLEKAKGKTIFLVIIGKDAVNIDDATTLAREANSIFKNSYVYSLDRDNIENSEIVERLGVASVPVPFIILISPMGIPITGDEPSELTAEQLVKSIPSPKQDEVYEAISNNNPAFVVVSKKDYLDKKKVLSVCKKASLTISNTPKIIEVDFDDSSEKDFLNNIGVSEMNGKSITVVFNSKGQIVETFTTIPSVNQLSEAVKKEIKKNSGCCPSGKGC